MSQLKGTPSTDDGGRLKKELRSLPKIKAPWWFESVFHRRLAGERLGKLRSHRLKPALAYAVVSLVVLGAVGYVMFPALFNVSTGTPDDNTVRHSQRRAADTVGSPVFQQHAHEIQSPAVQVPETPRRQSAPELEEIHTQSTPRLQKSQEELPAQRGVIVDQDTSTHIQPLGQPVRLRTSHDTMQSPDSSRARTDTVLKGKDTVRTPLPVDPSRR